MVLSAQDVARLNPDVRISRKCRADRMCWVLLPIFVRQVPVELAPWQMVPVTS
jgi:hypothetical protein